MLPPGHAEPGPFRTRRTPYMVPVMRAAIGAYRGIAVVGPSQFGKTDTIANIIGARLDEDPVPMMYIAPTRKFVEQTWEPRFTAMVRSSESLSRKAATGRSSTKTMKVISGVKVSFAWSGSATALAGEPACLVFVDERDRMEASVEGEGDPVQLASARHSTYSDGKTIVFSTPLIGTVDVYRHPATGLEHWKPATKDEVKSPTWMLWQGGTRHEWMWPCPHCSTYFAPRLRYLHWRKDCSPNDIERASLACPHCGGEIEEAARVGLNDRGLAISPGQTVVDGEAVGDGIRSEWYTLWISGVCAPWRRWVDNAREYARAASDGTAEELQACINTRFGELFAVSGEAPPWQDVAAMRLAYESGTIPAGVATLCMSVDVQQDRLYYVVRGWSKHRNLESWLVEHGEIHGATNEEAVWLALEEFRTNTYGDAGIKINRCFVDQKYRAQYVFAFCRKHKNWAFPAAGRLPRSETAEQQKPLSTSSIEVSPDGKIMKGGEAGIMRWTLNTDFFKRWVHDRIAKGDRGGFHIPSDATDDYCRQLVAEARVITPAGRAMWIKKQRENHYLDCEQMNVACAYSLRLQHFAQRRPEKSSQLGTAETPTEPRRPTPPRPPRRNWATQW